MDKNFFLLYNEIVYHIHTCEDMDDLKRSILAQVKLLIPCAYASLMEVEIAPNTREIFLCQVGTKKFLRFYKPFIGG